MSKRLRKGDQVLVVAGNDRGKIGKIIHCLEEKVVVEGVNVRKKHMKKTQENQKGQIIDIEKPIHISNVRPCVGDKPVKLRVRADSNGKREVYYNEGDKATAYREIKKSKGK